jgi:hypothetical protein
LKGAFHMQINTITNAKVNYLTANITYFNDNEGIRGDIELIEQLEDGIKADIISDFMLNAEGKLHIHNAQYLYFETPAYAYFLARNLKRYLSNSSASVAYPFTSSRIIYR